jgi:hypothetical protein
MVSLQNFLQLDDYNGVPLAAGKVYVYHQGRETLAEIYADINGETPIANPAILNSLGMQEIYVSNVYNYTVVVTDPYNNELFSRDIYPNGVDGDGNNRLYEGLDPICVNNDKMVISAKKATLSVQDPLYFVEDSSSAVCIGIENSAFEGLPYIENSAIELDPSGNISAISGYPFHSDSADNATSAESAGIVTDGWETGSDGRITAYNGTAFSAGKVYSGIDPIYVDNENDQIGVSSKDFIANSPLYFTEYDDRVELSISGLPDTPGLMYESSFNYESGKITGYHGSAISAGKVYSGIDPIHVDNVNDTISLDSATLGVQAPLYFVEDSESATIIGLDSAQVVTPTIPVSGINGIKISESADTVFFEVSGNYVDYSAIAGTDNVITGINGSALAAGANYSAGDNIVIDNNTISVASAITLVDPVTLRIMHANGKNNQFIDYSGDAGAIVNPSGLYVSDINETEFTLVDKELVTIRNGSGSVDMSNMAPGPSIDLIRMSGNTPVSNIQMHTWDHQYPEYRAYIRATDKDSATSSYNQLDLNTVDVTITHLPDNNDPALYRHYSLTGVCTSAISALTIINSADMTQYSAGDNIDITNHVISGKDWGSDISAASAYAYEQATAAIPAPFDPTYISGQIDNKLDSAIYATDSANFATTGDLNDLVTSIAETYQSTAGMTAYQSALTFSYDSLDNISAINNSGITMTPSRDLYVKEPLYTGMTGTSAYIGVYESAIQPLVFGYTAIGE